MDNIKQLNTKVLNVINIACAISQ